MISIFIIFLARKTRDFLLSSEMGFEKTTEDTEKTATLCARRVLCVNLLRYNPIHPEKIKKPQK